MKIVDIQLRRIHERTAERGITLELSPAAKERLVRKTYDPVYGARPLKRRIQKNVLDPLARKLLAGEFSEGDLVKVDIVGDTDSFSFTRKDTEVLEEEISVAV